MSIRIVRAAVAAAALFMAASCTEQVTITCDCSDGVSNVKVESESLGSMSYGQEKTADVSKHGSSNISWTYQGYSYSGKVSGASARASGYTIDCTDGY